MNEALRLLRKLVRRMGHDIRTSEHFVLRPIKNLNEIDNGQELMLPPSYDWQPLWEQNTPLCDKG